MEILTEATLRSGCPLGNCEYSYDEGTFITQSARQFAKERNIRLVPREWAAMTYGKPSKDVVPQGDKPESMTHIRAGELVVKTDPRIRFRGKLDSFEAELLCLMAGASEKKRMELVKNLGEVLTLCREILAAEVKESPLPDWTLFGMSPEEIHRLSHQPPHPVPDYRMGETAMALNRLRALSRELELHWLSAYGLTGREDIPMALNRISSALYVLFRKEVKTHE